MYQESHQQGHYVSFALAQFLHYLIIIFNLYLSLTHPPRVTVSDRVPAVKGICWSWITPWSNQLPVRPFAGQPAPPCFQARFIRPLFCKAFIIFTKPCTLSFINVNIHTTASSTVNPKRPFLLCCASLWKQSAPFILKYNILKKQNKIF